LIEVLIFEKYNFHTFYIGMIQYLRMEALDGGNESARSEIAIPMEKRAIHEVW
jgi:hypothetical protein